MTRSTVEMNERKNEDWKKESRKKVRQRNGGMKNPYFLHSLTRTRCHLSIRIACKTLYLFDDMSHSKLNLAGARPETSAINFEFSLTLRFCYLQLLVQ